MPHPKVVRLDGSPLAHPEPIRFIPSRNQPPTFGERLVEFMRRWQFRIGIGCYCVAVAVGCYFAFQVGRGL